MRSHPHSSERVEELEESYGVLCDRNYEHEVQGEGRPIHDTGNTGTGVRGRHDIEEGTGTSIRGRRNDVHHCYEPGQDKK